MAKAPAKKVPAKAAPAPASEEQGPKVVYDKLSVVEYSVNSQHGPLTVEDMRDLMYWETEKEYQGRMVAAEGGEPEHYIFGDVGPKRKDNGMHQPVHCMTLGGDKVVCWNNANNRPFDSDWCEDLIHTILTGQWAGPHTIPGETINGETIRISRYGRMLSGQHQGTALMLADGRLQAARAKQEKGEPSKYPFWDGHDHVFLETLVVFGLSEDERVLRTIDYNKPRTAADMLYTMPLFREKTPVERKEMTRMLSAAIDTLWTRTAAKGYKTHPEIVGFLERHKRLLKTVEHLFVENGADKDNGGRRISKLKLSAGQCAALCYLMGCGSEKTTAYSDEYRNEMPPSEKNLDWSLWDQARAFWAGLAGDRGFIPVRTALGRLLDSSPSNDDNPGLGGRADEKLAILSKAWAIFKDHPPEAGPAFNEDDLAPSGALALTYTDLDAQGRKLPDGKWDLVDQNDFLGIDCPTTISNRKARAGAGEPEPPPPTPEQLKQLKAEADARNGILTPEQLKKQNEEAEEARRAEQKAKLAANRAARPVRK